MAGAEKSISFDHIAIATTAISNAPEFLVGELGGASGFGSPNPEFRWWHWDYAGGGRIEVLEPNGEPGGFVHRFLESRGPGIHHTTFKVRDLRQFRDRAEDLGYTIVGYDDSRPSWKEAFLHPKQAMGVVVQFAQGGDEDGPHWQDSAPDEPPSPPPSATIVGLRLQSGDPDRVMRQWAGVLAGEAAERDGEIVFTWPGSSMRVAVTIEPGAPDEAVAIEVRAERKLELPSGRHPALGARFVQL